MQANTSEPVGFMIGAHGMDDGACKVGFFYVFFSDKMSPPIHSLCVSTCENQAQYGFLYLDSSNNRVRPGCMSQFDGICWI